jgi:hypothetical protein
MDSKKMALLKLIVIFEQPVDSYGSADQRETPQEQSDEEAPGPPAERECLQRKSTGKFNRAQKIEKPFSK